MKLFNLFRSPLPASGRGLGRWEEAAWVVRLGLLGSELSAAMIEADAQRGHDALVQVKALLQEARGTPSAPPTIPGNGPVRFVVDTLFLQESLRFICGPARPTGRAQPVGSFKEVFHYVGGFQLDPATVVLSRLVRVDFAEQSSGKVRVEDASNIQALTALSEAGLLLASYFHSHPGEGAAATEPSVVDWRMQDRLEAGGHLAVGAIFSATGRYLRFFAKNPERFRVEFKGNGVREVDRHVYELALANGQVHV